MKVKSNIFLILLILVLLPTEAMACSDEQQTRHMKLAQNITTSYREVNHNGNVTFSITFSNLHRDLMMRDISHEGKYENRKGEVTIDGFTPGSNNRFDFYAYSGYCYNYFLSSIYVQLPFYNSYSEKEECKGIEDHPLCQKWTKQTVDEKTFQAKITAYKKSLEPKEELPKMDLPAETTFSRIMQRIGDMYVRSYFILLPVIIVICCLVIYRLRKKRKLI